MEIKIPKMKLSLIEKNTFLYEVEVATRWARWHLEKKYQEFQQLHRKLSQQFDHLPEFPQSLLNYFSSLSEDQASDYQQILEIYLQQTSKRKDIINSEAYIDFLQLYKYSPTMLSNKPKFLHEFQMKQRINDEGKVILDFFYDDQFIVFATGNDSSLEKFNSFIANSKFPWESQEEVQYVLPLGTIECWLKKKDVLEYKRVWARNYPIQTRCFVFSVNSMTMAVGLSDGSVQIFKLIHKPRYIYYELPQTVNLNTNDIIGLHLDEVNQMIYTASQEGWIHIIEVDRTLVVGKKEIESQITKMHADTINRRLFVALAEGNIEIFQYLAKGSLQHLYSLCPPATTDITCLLFDPIKNYLFSSCFENGEIFIFEIAKRGHQKLSKQVGTIKNKEKIVDLIWKAEKMELVATVQSGEIFFWNTVKAEHIYMLKAFQNISLSKSMYIPHNNMIITASRGRKVKFWEIPSSWRDVVTQIEEERQIEIRRKVENMYKVREAVKRREVNSDEDDLKGWHWSSSESQEEDGQQQ